MKIFVITGCTSPNNLGYKIAKAIKEKIEDAYVVGYVEKISDEVDHSFIDEIYEIDLSKDFDMTRINNSFGIYALINAAGWNNLQWFNDDFDWDIHEKIMNINFKSPCKLIQKLLPSLQKVNGTVLNIISMGAVKPFRTSFSYNTSKAALRMATIQLARENSDLTIFGISPNELEGTHMTEDVRKQVETIRGWSPEQAENYRLAAANSQKLTSPDLLAEFIAHILQSKNHHHHFTGCDIQYGF
jgi:short-subunit dehydrogenase